MPTGWEVLQGDPSWIGYPASRTLQGRASVESAPPRGKSLLLGSALFRLSSFQGSRVLAARFEALEGSPTVYLGLEYFDRSGDSIATLWSGGKAVRLKKGEDRWLQSPALNPSSFPKNAVKARVVLYLGRLWGGRVLVDQVSLLPAQELERVRASLLPEGDMETDANSDGVPDGFTLLHGNLDDGVFAEGFASVRLKGPPSGLRRIASVETPPFPVRMGQTIALGTLTRSSSPSLKASIQWIGLDARKKVLPGAPPAVPFSAQTDWKIARDALTLEPIPGIAEIHYLKARISAELSAGESLWIDDLRIERASGPQPSRASVAARLSPRTRPLGSTSPSGSPGPSQRPKPSVLKQEPVPAPKAPPPSQQRRAPR